MKADILNFDAAVEMRTDDGIAVVSLRITDDLASASLDKRYERRGIAGALFIYRIVRHEPYEMYFDLEA